MVVSSCFRCINIGSLNEAIVYLLCQWSDNMKCVSQEGVGSPIGVKTPGFIGQLYYDTIANAYYRSTGLTIADWMAITTGGLVWGPNATILTSLSITSSSILGASVTTLYFPTLGSITSTFNVTLNIITSISLPNLVSVGSSFTATSSGLLLLSLPSLQSTIGVINIGSTKIASLNLTALKTCGGGISTLGCTLLTSVSIPVLLPTTGTNFNFSGCALTDVSVNGILARCISNSNYVLGTVNLSGGTNAAPTGQGILDKATLLGRGV